MQWSQNLCRTCGQINETCHFIYNENAPSALEKKIKKYLNINLYKGDYKPKQICNNCVVKLNDVADFITNCHNTNEKFESIYLNSQTWHNRNYVKPPPQKQSVIVSSKQVADNLDYELYKNTGIVLENLNITNCQLNDAEMLGLVGTGDYSSGNRGNYCKKKQSKDPCTNGLKRAACGEAATKDNSYDTECADGKKVCYIRYNNSYSTCVSSNTGWCKNIIKTERKRTVTVDSVKKSLRLPENKKYSRKKAGQKAYSCPHCGRIFLRSSSLNSHMALHTNIRPYKCQECTKSFAVKNHLTTHKKVHSDQHKCPFCQKKFSVPSKLERHVRIHTNDKPYVCNYLNCTKSFSDKRNLQGHKLTHITEKKYSCVVCNKMFKTLHKLKQHSKCHSSGVKYSCDLCSKTYKYKSNLVSHLKKHNNVCPYCKKNCESNTLLVEHLKTCGIYQ